MDLINDKGLVVLSKKVPECASCDALKLQLKSIGVPFEDVDVASLASDPKFSRVAIMGVPKMIFNGSIICDGKPATTDELMGILRKHGVMR